MSSTRRALLLACASLLTLALGVIVLELVFGQWLRQGSWSRAERLNVVRDKRIRYDVTHIYGAGAPAITYTRDANGLRGDCTEPRLVRLLTIGGSTTDQVYIDDGATWQSQLQRRIGAARGGERWCIANAGVDGHSTFGHLAAFEQWFPLIPELKPDYYLLYIGVNDAAFRIERSASDENERVAAGWLGPLKLAVRNNSALYALWARATTSRRDAPLFAAHKLLFPTDGHYTSTATSPGVDEPLQRGAQAFRERLARLLRAIQDRGGKAICVSQPSIVYRQFDGAWRGIPDVFVFGGRQYNGLDYRASLHALNGVMASDCPAAGGYFVDLEAKAFAPSDYYDAVHMNPAGAEKLGAYLFEEFRRQGIAGLSAGSHGTTGRVGP